MKTFCGSIIFAFFLLAAQGADTKELILSADFAGSAPKTIILGPLSFPLGEFVTIEGVPCAIGMGGTKKYSSADDVNRFGIHSLEISKVNGTAISPPVILPIFGNRKFSPGEYFMLRGYQHGVFGPGNIDPEVTGDFDLPQVTGYGLKVYFVVTKEIDSHDK